MLADFQIISGSVTGREHTLRGKNNQDAYAVSRTEQSIIAVVADGCSGGAASEVGSQLGVHLAQRHIERLLGEQGNSITKNEPPGVQTFLKRLEEELLGSFSSLAQAMGGKTGQIVCDYFLFTLLGAVVTPELSMIFSWGDGAYAANGDVHEILADVRNQPPYLGYKLLPAERVAIDPGRLQFNLLWSGPTSGVSSLMIGSDGVNDFIRSQDKMIPGRKEPLGPLSRFWTEAKYGKNPDLLRRHLVIANREHHGLDPQTGELKKETGLLPDDTTLIIIKA